MKKKLLLLATLIITMFSTHVRAQDTEFWFTGPVSLSFGSSDIYMGGGGFVFTNPTHLQATISIHYYKDNTDTTIVIPAYSYNYMRYPNEQDILDKIDDLTGPVGVVRTTGIHITATRPVTCYYIYDREFQQETFLLKGKASLGTDFYTTTGYSGSIYSTDNGVYLGTASNPYISILGTEDNTLVTFDLKSMVTNYPIGVSSATLNKGESLTLRTSSGRPAGSHIYSDKPITITAGEECRNSNGGSCDHIGDQLIANPFAGTVYVMPLSAGFMPTSPSWIQNYFEIVALEPNTNVEIDWGSGPTPLTTLANAGDTYISEPTSVYSANSCATISSNNPINVMQNTGHEATLAPLPNFYATNTHRASFYSYWRDYPGKDIYPGVSIIYKEHSDTSFFISYPGQPETLLFPWITANARQIDGQGNVPSFPGWKYIRFTLPAAATNQIVSIKNTTSVFQLGFSSSFPDGTNMNYLSSFNSQFSFDPDTIWTCANIPTSLIGGIASYYKWTLPDGSIQEGADLNTIKAPGIGMYILEMTQGFNTLIDTCWVQSISFSLDGNITKDLTKPVKVNRAQTFSPNTNPEIINKLTEIKWTLPGGSPSTSTAATPSVVWNSPGMKHCSLYMKYETVYPDSTRAVCDTLIEFRVPVQSSSVEYIVDPSSPDKVGVDDADKTDDQLYYQGQSKDDPFNLDDALSQASQGDIVYVPEGTYTPGYGGSFTIDCDSVSVVATGDPQNTIINGNNGSAVIFDLSPTSGACAITSATRLEGFTIQGGKATNGAGVIFKNGASGTLANCIIRNNQATNDGGGIYIEPFYAPAGCTLTSPDPILYNLEISGNTSRRGAGIFNTSGSTPTMTNVTIGGNSASISGGGIYNDAASPDIRNSIIYGNLTASTPLKDEFMNNGGNPQISFSLIKGCKVDGLQWNTAFGTDNGNNLDKNALYKSAGYDGDNGNLKQGNYRLSASSPAIDAGRNRFVTYIPTDLDGFDRIYVDVVDMGAYEYKEGTPPIIQHEVVIPKFDNVTTNPLPGVHYAIGHKNFTIIFTPNQGYTLEGLKITTGSIWQDQKGGMVLTYNSDSTVTAVFNEVTEPLYIQISGVSPVSNTSIDEMLTLSTGKELLHINANKSAKMAIHTIAGQLVLQQTIGVGNTTISLQAGIYIVSFDDTIKQKVLIK